MEDIVAIIMLFGGGTVAMLSFSPVGKAIAERIRGGAQGGPDPEVLAELDHLRQDVGELQERLDFAERLLAQHRDPARLEPGSGERS